MLKLAPGNISIRFPFKLTSLCLLLALSGCAVMRPRWKDIELTNDEIKIAKRLEIDENELKKMKAKPLYKFSEQELDKYLSYLQEVEPNLKKRVQHLARKSTGQPYQIYLLGEFPFEIYDPEPLYSLKKSDCLVFCEHIYAMALAHNWPSFFALLQRIRYKNGEIGMLTRNHETAPDWNPNNAWLVKDITEELVGDKAVKGTMIVDRASFFKQWNIGQDIPVDTLELSYILYDVLPEIVNKLQMGDFVNIVRGYEDNKWVGHVGLITLGDDETVNFLHSESPRVVEQPIMELYYNAEEYNEECHKENKPCFYGFKFLRLREDPISELIQIDGPDAPRVTIPSGILLQ
ncbi:hypothetical protein CH333_01275 [candidate division WOR-3 bacterium JGI_Cruoil_03_44_89]|uniref:DUF1460 domain-containing protein n=1 Tax=candidate division WOR-3 bacterium JGI_Cruoil_03_44_89 TaxID=1973748 RepID=A0A235BZV6_UNCW3|nr:MAG: hypothetical protein CH333_01275 [candidate division WOR-3 bacterium JGI_Cruoil_03_44_89]